MTFVAQMPAQCGLVESYPVQVLRFQLAMQQPIHQMGMPVPEASLELAEKLVSEEVKEFYAAWNRFVQSQSLENLTEVVDGALDSVYVLLWTLNTLGVPVNACWEEIQRSNMAKIGPDGVKKNAAGKVMKPEGWKPPDLFGVLMTYRDSEEYQHGFRNS